jgi:ABC-2 type transport system permease protein
MQIVHVGRALRALTTRELTKFAQQRGRLFSALVRPLVWLVALGAGFQNVFGLPINPPYKTYTLYQVYMVPGLLGMILLFHGMQSSLSMVYDREMGVMRLLLTAPLPRWMLLFCKLIAGTALSVITGYVFLAVCIPFDVTFGPLHWLAVLPAMIACGLMLGALGLLLSVHIGQLENFASTMNFVIFPMFFFSTALYPLWVLEQSPSPLLYYLAMANPFTYAVELIRFALYGEFNPVATGVVCGTTALFFMFAVYGYNPQRGVIRRAPQPA